MSGRRTTRIEGLGYPTSEGGGEEKRREFPLRFYCMRHGAPIDNTDDPDRELTSEGEDTVAAMADWMLRKNEIPAFIFASPSVRTQQTAEILRNAFGLDK